ncbi:hypothetical protein INR49_003466, partial [Caranx melampygus]
MACQVEAAIGHAQTLTAEPQAPKKHNEETDKCTARQRLLSLLGHPLERIRQLENDRERGKLVEVEHATMEKKRAVELYEGMELKKEMEKLDDQSYNTSAASECNMNLVEDMEPLKEALGYTDVQKLVNKVVFQRATKEQLTSEKTQCDEQIEEEAKVLADLDLQYTKVKFSEKAAATRCDELKQTEAKLSQEMNRVERLQAALKESQDLLETVEQGVDNLYFRMSCVPMEGFPRAECSDCKEKLMEIKASLPTLLQIASKETADISGLDQDMFVSLLEKFCTMETRNNRRPTTAPDPDLQVLVERSSDWIKLKKKKTQSSITETYEAEVMEEVSLVTSGTPGVVSGPQSWFSLAI